jgi:hypothetical protein
MVAEHQDWEQWSERLDPDRLLPPGWAALFGRDWGLRRPLPTRAALGLPEGVRIAPCAMEPTASDKRWYGYIHLMIGIDQPHPAPGERAAWPCIRITDAEGRPKYTWQIWLSWVWRRGRGLIAERRWHPQHGDQYAVHDSTRDASPSAVVQAWRSFELSDKELGHSTRKRLVAIADIRAVLDQREHLPPRKRWRLTAENTGEHLAPPVTGKTVQRACIDAETTWEALKREYTA